MKSKNLKTHDYVTIAWGPLLTVIDEKWWFNASIWGKAPLLYDVQNDPNLENDLSKEYPEVCKRMLDLAIKDAGGKIPEAFAKYETMPGCTPYKARSRKLII